MNIQERSSPKPNEFLLIIIGAAKAALSPFLPSSHLQMAHWPIIAGAHYSAGHSRWQRVHEKDCPGGGREDNMSYRL